MVDNSELQLRWSALQELIREYPVAGMLISTNANILYSAGRVLSGFVFVPRQGEVQIFVRRPSGLDGVTYIKKFEDLALHLPSELLSEPIMMECDTATFSEIARYRKLFTGELVNGSSILRAARSIKSSYELEQMRGSARAHTASYRSVPLLYKKGMSDLELSIEVERQMRLEGSLGLFRIAGGSMEIFAGSLLVGDNADAPSPYDFALGGAGLDGSIPVGANGTVIEGDMSVMVDLGGNFTGYICDMTRVFSVGNLGELAHHAHQTSIAICRAVEAMAKEGVAAKDLYNLAYKMVEEASLVDYFMGHCQKAPFVGHGIGLEINELPVLAPRSRDILKAGMVFALEPKFVIPKVGAVGVENSYIVHSDRVERITLADEQILPLDLLD